jgi:hypothetical protein
MAISRAALSRLLDGGFRCSARDSPDDMLIGMYLQGLGIPLVHNHGFHQVCGWARPSWSTRVSTTRVAE